MERRKSVSNMMDQATAANLIGDRVRAWLLQVYPSRDAKDIARGEDVSIQTARRWLSGCLPENKHMAALAVKFGKAFVAFVYEPACGDMRLARLDAQLEDISARLAQVKQDIDNARSGDLHRRGDADGLANGNRPSHQRGHMDGNKSPVVEGAAGEAAVAAPAAEGGRP